MSKEISIKENFNILRQSGFKINPTSSLDGKVLNLDLGVMGAVHEAIFSFLSNLPEDDFISPSQASAHLGSDTELKRLHYPLKLIEDLPSIAGQSTVLWNKIGQLPGFQQSGIRKMGREIFLSFPCFQEFAHVFVDHGKDPLGEVFVASNLTHKQSTVNYLAAMIEKMGIQVQSGVMDHTPFIDGYAPRIGIFMNEDFTFKLVMDRPEYGAPISLNSIYAWPGGLKAYRRMALEVVEPQLAAGQLALVK